MQVLRSSDYPWHTRQMAGLQIHYGGDLSEIEKIVATLHPETPPDASRLKAVLLTTANSFGLIVEAPGYTLAITDCVASYPLFHATTPADGGTESATPLLSPSARAIARCLPTLERNDLSLLELSMQGYVSGNRTLYHQLRQLRAAEWALWLPTEATPRIQRYFHFFPESFRSDSEETLLEELAAITDRSIDRLITYADGRQIALPLSGGLDSRILICKLVERGYPNLTSYTYGPPNNSEAPIARQVAETLNVPWRMVGQDAAGSRDFYWSQERRRFWDYADGLSRIPGIQGMHPLALLKEQGVVSEEAVIVNGQSGDFTSGGHISKALMPESAPTLATTIDALVAKHCALWEHLNTPENHARIHQAIIATLEEVVPNVAEASLPHHIPPGLFEYWEWQERQTKLVVRNQTIYSALGYDWHLPLWDFEAVRFWRDIPLPLKYGQSLYRTYLHRYDYKQLFSGIPNKELLRWPGLSILAIPMARMVGLVAGQEAKGRFYRQARYFGHYSNLFRAYDFREFSRLSRHARNAFSLQARTWCLENGITDAPLFEGIEHHPSERTTPLKAR
ncbi:MAG: asparagine synthase [Magnetococcales bacterium]|nr:asparagine synthase [Magnetococcales bacterium]